jgi:cytochrome d ubiquinol oxidase subunit I
MDTLILSRWQFAITTVYHFFFVPLTLGLSILLAVMETAYVRTGDEMYKGMAKFWGKLFVINFAVGVATGIVLEFQFGMNWSEYSRFVGDIFGAPLAIEALLAFFLESTFLGIWIFGWDRLSKGAHLAAIWLVAIGSNLSALWILIANSFMHEPVGYRLNPAAGRAEMTDFWALVTNPHAWLQFPHVITSGITTAALFVLGISAYHLLRKTEPAEAFKKSFRFAAVYGLIGVVLVVFIGHTQAQHMVAHQPMKMAAAEALWESADPADLSVVAIFDTQSQETLWSIEIPRGLSVMAYNSLEGEVKGIQELQQEFVDRHGPGDYIPPVFLSYWSFRLMVGTGVLMFLVLAYAVYLVARGRIAQRRWFLRILPWVLLLPYVANTAGWLLTELGRQPWIVYELQLTADAVSPSVSGHTVLLSLIGFGLVYAGLIVADVYLLVKHARQPKDLTS